MCSSDYECGSYDGNWYLLYFKRLAKMANLLHNTPTLKWPYSILNIISSYECKKVVYILAILQESLFCAWKYWCMKIQAFVIHKATQSTIKYLYLSYVYLYLLREYDTENHTEKQE